MLKKKLGIVVITVMIVGAIVPALIVPDVSAASEAGKWMIYTPNHPNGCAPLPFDCYVIWVYP